jgi:small-conductance mechanosensitive channel
MRLAMRRPPADGSGGNHRPAVRASVVACLLSVAGLVGAGYGDVHGPGTGRQLTAIIGTVVFVVFGVGAVRAATTALARVSARRLSPSQTAFVRLTLLVAGYLLIVVVTVSMLAVPIGRLLLGGAITGIIIGVAAQQALANVFAGLMLMVVRPFHIGHRIELHSGALGGDYAGTVTDLGLTYITLDTAEGPLLLPNAGVLGAAIHTAPRPGTPSTGRDDPASGHDHPEPC